VPETPRRSRPRRWPALLAAALVALPALAACGSAAAPQASSGAQPAAPPAASSTAGGLKGSVVKIGAIVPSSGPLANWGKQEVGTLQMLQDEVNKAGGIKGKKLQIVIEDDAANPGQSADLMRKLATQENVLAVAGPLTSSSVSAAFPVAVRLKVPAMAFASSDPPLIGKFQPWGFRDVIDEARFASITVPYFVKTYHVKKVAIIYNTQDETSTGISTRILPPVFEKLGVPVVNKDHPITMQTNSVDLSSQVTALKALHVDGLILGADFVPGIYVLQEMQKQGVDIPVIGGSPLVDNVLLKAAPKIPVVVPMTYLPTQDQPASAVDFRKKMEAWFQSHGYPAGTTPNMYDVNIYDTVRMFIQAIEKGGVTNDPSQLAQDRQKIASYLKTIKDFPGVTGPISITAGGDATKPAFVVVVQDGQWHAVQQKTL
jgi:branched-chain amino acid transport system substrate-binding protein